MQVNHNWFALVTVQLSERCRRRRGRRAPGEEGSGEAGEEGEEEGEEEDTRLRLFMRVSLRSREVLCFGLQPVSVSYLLLCVCVCVRMCVCVCTAWISKCSPSVLY